MSGAWEPAVGETVELVESGTMGVIQSISGNTLEVAWLDDNDTFGGVTYVTRHGVRLVKE